jgi:hypothetical protein
MSTATLSRKLTGRRCEITTTTAWGG